MKNLKEGKFVIKSIPIILDNKSPYTDVEKKEARDEEAKCLIDDFITLEQYLGAQKTFDDDVEYVRALDEFLDVKKSYNDHFTLEMKELYRELFPL